MKFILLWLICVKQYVCFLPNSQSIGGGSWHHASITRTAMLKAAAKYLAKKGLDTANQQRVNSYQKVETFFGSDGDGLQRFEDVVRDIIRENNKVQLERKNEAKISFNGEDIKSGHFHLVTLAKNIDREAAKDFPDLEIIKQWIGQYLYTLQSFYSNTNWVEMNDRKINENIGKMNRSDRIQVAEFDAFTCISKDYNVNSIGRGSCNDNLIVKDRLTSGYRSGQDIEKPISNQGNYGKCSHGGRSDASRTRTATCGINKETLNHELSPHWKKHLRAGNLAVEATEKFFTERDSDSKLNTEEIVFNNILGLKEKKPSSLTFVIDISTSMAEEIKGVTDWTVNKVFSVKNSTMEPANYVLVTFSDPIKYTSDFVTENGNEMVNKLKSLSVAGGLFDCEELTYSGLKRAVELSLEGSNVICFTDADAKDEHLKPAVYTQARLKNISISFTRFGSCNRRKRSEASEIQENKTRQKRAAPKSDFTSLARSTGGKIYSATIETLWNIMDEAFSETFPSAEVIVDFFTFNSSSVDMKDFYVDETLRILRISIKGIRNKNEVDVISSSGTKVDSLSANTVQIIRPTINNNQLDITIKVPSPGKWKIVRKSDRTWAVNITGQSNVDFTFALFQAAKDGYFHETVGNPVAGQEYTIVATVFGFNKTETNVTLRVIDMQGYLLKAYILNAESDTDTDIRYTAKIRMLSKKFLLQLSVQDKSGNVFTRIKWICIKPVSIKLHLIPIFDMLVVGVEKNVSYRITNFGRTNQTLTTEVQVNSGIIVSSSRRYHHIGASATQEDFFTIKADQFSSDTITYNVRVVASGSQDTLQALSRRLYVTFTQHPVCNVVFTEGSCSNITRKNCMEHKWLAITKTSFSGIEIASVTLARPGPHTTMTIGDTDNLSGPLQVNVSGNCCASSNRLDILDTDGFLGRCSLKFSKETEIIGTGIGSRAYSSYTPAICICLYIVAQSIIKVY